MSELGDLLRSARDKKGVTLSQAAEVTRIKQPFLEALEEGHYKSLPGQAYITGFLRNYASYLGLHPDDIVQEYYARQPAMQLAVKPATRVLANGHERYLRTRVLWAMAGLVLLLGAAFAIYRYNDTYAHPYSAPLITPSNLGPSAAPVTGRVSAPPKPMSVRLRALAPVWVRVTVDGTRTFQGILRPGTGVRHWTGYHSVYVLTYDGSHLIARFNGRVKGRLSGKSGPVVGLATASGWKIVS